MKYTNGMKTEEERRRLIEDFANEMSVCKGGNINVSVGHGHISFQPSDPFLGGMKYEDSNFVSDQIRGAESLLFYLERNGYQILRRKNGKKRSS